MDISEEWNMVEQLYEIHDEFTPEAEEFIIKLYEYMDPHVPFEEAVVGLPESVEKMRKWIYSLYKKHVDLDPDASQEIWDDEEI